MASPDPPRRKMDGRTCSREGLRRASAGSVELIDAPPRNGLTHSGRRRPATVGFRAFSRSTTKCWPRSRRVPGHDRAGGCAMSQVCRILSMAAPAPQPASTHFGQSRTVAFIVVSQLSRRVRVRQEVRVSRRPRRNRPCRSPPPCRCRMHTSVISADRPVPGAARSPSPARRVRTRMPAASSTSGAATDAITSSTPPSACLTSGLPPGDMGGITLNRRPTGSCFPVNS